MKTDAENPTGEGGREVLLGIEFGAVWQRNLPASSYEDGRRTVVQRLAPGQVAPLIEFLRAGAAEADARLREGIEDTVKNLEEMHRDGLDDEVGSVARWAVRTFSPQFVEKLAEVLQIKLPGAAEDLKTYAEHLREEGRQDAQVATIEGFLDAGIKWSTIKRATGIDQAAFDALRGQQRSSDREGPAS